jgi:hypothetical protein
MTEWLVLGIVAVTSVAVVVLAGRRNRLKATVSSAAVVLILLWLLALNAFRTDWRDADGIFDCWPSCTSSQKAVGMVLTDAPVSLIVCLLTAAIVDGRRRRPQSQARL